MVVGRLLEDSAETPIVELRKYREFAALGISLVSHLIVTIFFLAKLLSR